MQTWSERMTNAGAEVIGTVISNEAPTAAEEKELKELADKLVKAL